MALGPIGCGGFTHLTVYNGSGEMNTELEQFQTNVKRLGEITSRLEAKPVCGINGPPKIFELEDGEARVWLLHERESVTIVKSHLSPNATFPVHTHSGIEVIVVFEGSAVYTSGDIARRLNPGQCVSVPAGKGHKIKAGPDGAWFSVTLVPRSKSMMEVIR